MLEKTSILGDGRIGKQDSCTHSSIFFKEHGDRRAGSADDFHLFDQPSLNLSPAAADSRPVVIRHSNHRNHRGEPCTESWTS